MIKIEDKDMPITVADKLINATKDEECLSKLHCPDMFDVDELEEIANYLLVYCNAHRSDQDYGAVPCE